jgi:hypothetical protein
MTRRKQVARTIGVAAVALGLMAQAAQARPIGMSPGGPGEQPSAPAHQAPLTNRGPLGAAVAAANRDTSPAAVSRQVAGSPGHSLNGMQIVGGAAIIVFVGALGTMLFRQRPGWPATA